MTGTHSEIINNDHFEKQYVFQEADPTLHDLVEYYWQLDLRGRQFKGDDFAESIFANINTSVVFNMGSAFDVLDKKTGEGSRLNKSVVIGHHTHTLQYHHYAGNFLFGIKFRPAGLNKLFGISSADLNNRFAEAELFFRNSFIEEKLAEAGTIRERSALADAMLMHLLAKSGSSFKINSVHRALIEMALREKIYRVSQLAGSLHLTKRTLERYFKEEIGLTPKTCLSILRFREALKKHKEKGPADFEELGYTDRSHFLKDYRKFIS